VEVEVSRTRPVITPDATYNVGSFRHQGIVSVRVRVSVRANQDYDTVRSTFGRDRDVAMGQTVGRGAWGLLSSRTAGPLDRIVVSVLQYFVWVSLRSLVVGPASTWCKINYKCRTERRQILCHHNPSLGVSQLLAGF